MRVAVSPAARADIAAVGRWISADRPARAHSFMRELFAACRRVGATPLGLPIVPGQERTELRRILLRPYLIFYRVHREHVEIVRIPHGARDIPRVLRTGEP